jgi:hypothetical protein
MAMSLDRNAGSDDSLKIENSSTERVKEFKSRGMLITDLNILQVEIRNRLKVRITCCHSVHNLFS